jgi:rhodanese-related sulfurtransferase/transcriptional regulator with XRE-family HTH domain
MVRAIGPSEAQALLSKGSVDVIDVREPHEWATGHLPGARLVPLDTLRGNWSAANVRSPVLFVCAKGGRSMTAAEFAVTQGVNEVYSLDGGTSGWLAAALPMVKPASATGSAPSVATGDQQDDEVVDPELDALVGSNVKALRAQRGYSLDVLAGLSGVGRQTLGQIEIGRTVPSVGTLWKIARAFEVPFSVLLARPENLATRVFRGAQAKRLVSADGRFSSRALFSADDKGKVEFYELWLAGHGREDAEAHAPGTRENLIVTAGRLSLELGPERFELAKGDAIVFLADLPHAYVNLGSDECTMNLVMTYGG